MMTRRLHSATGQHSGSSTALTPQPASLYFLSPTPFFAWAKCFPATSLHRSTPEKQSRRQITARSHRLGSIIQAVGPLDSQSASPLSQACLGGTYQEKVKTILPSTLWDQDGIALPPTNSCHMVSLKVGTRQ